MQSFCDKDIRARLRRREKREENFSEEKRQHSAAGQGVCCFTRAGEDLAYDLGIRETWIAKGTDPTAYAIYQNSIAQSKPVTVQAKLEISQPGDASEIQADKVADAVSNGDVNMSRMTMEQTGSDIMMKGEGGSLTTTPEFNSQLEGTKGQGSAMDATTQSKLESHTGTDLSGVKIHTGSTADSLSESINAKAFTHGQDIYFKGGNYSPQTPEGEKLLAHEVTHTVQQRGGVQRQPEFDIDYESLEFGDSPQQTVEEVESYVVNNSIGTGLNIYEKADFSPPKLIENNTSVVIHWQGVVLTPTTNNQFELYEDAEMRINRTGTSDLIFNKVLIEIVEPAEGSSYKTGDKIEGYIYNNDRWENLQFLLDPAEIFDLSTSRYRRVKAIVKEHDDSLWGGFFADFPDTKTKYLVRFFTDEDQRMFKADTELYDRVKELLSEEDWEYATALWGKAQEEVAAPQLDQKDIKRTEELQKYAEAYKAYSEYEQYGFFSSSSAKESAKKKLIAELDKLDMPRYQGESAIENFEADMGDVKEERLKFFRDFAVKEAFFLMDISERVLVGEAPVYLEGYVQPIKDELKKQKSKFEELKEIDHKYKYAPIHDNLMELSHGQERNAKLAEIREALGTKFPILLDENLDLEELYENYAVNDENNLYLQELLEDTIVDRHKDIDATRANLESDPDLVWEFENLIELTKKQMNLGDEMLDSMVDEKAKSVQHRKMLIQAGLGAIGIGLAIVSFGELSPAAMALVADVGIGLAAIDAYMIYTDTRIKKAASNIAHDKALVLTQDDPSYWWLALPIISMGFDMLSSLRMLKGLKGVENLAEKEADALIENVVKDSKLPENTSAEDVATKLKQTLAQRREAAENVKLLAEAQKKTKAERALDLAKDPKKPKPDYYEGEIGAETEPTYGYFKRDPTGDADFISISGDYEGKTFDAIGSPQSAMANFKMDQFTRSLVSHINKSVDYLLVDVRYMTSIQQQQIMDFLVVNHADSMNRIIFIGLK